MACFEASTLYILQETDTCYISHLKRVPRNHRLKRARDLGEKCSIRDHQQESMTCLVAKKTSFFDYTFTFHLFSKQINVQPSIFGSCIPPGGISLDPGRPGTSIKAWKAGSIARCQGQRAIGKLLGGERLSKDDKGRSQVRKCMLIRCSES